MKLLKWESQKPALFRLSLPKMRRVMGLVAQIVVNSVHTKSLLKTNRKQSGFRRTKVLNRRTAIYSESHQQNPKLVSINGFGFRPLVLNPSDQLRWAKHRWMLCFSHLVLYTLTNSPFFSLKHQSFQGSYYLNKLTRLPTSITLLTNAKKLPTP